MPNVREKLISLSALSVMVAPCRTALSILGGGGGSDGPPGNEVGGRQTAHQPCLALALHSLCAAGQEGRPSSMWATNIPTERDLKHHLLLPSRFPTIIWFKEGEFSERFSVLLDSLFSFFL